MISRSLGNQPAGMGDPNGVLVGEDGERRAQEVYRCQSKGVRQRGGCTKEYPPRLWCEPGISTVAPAFRYSRVLA
jgi:hypothetical protein